MTDEVLIQVKGLKKAFGDFYALNGVDAEQMCIRDRHGTDLPPLPITGGSLPRGK